jgi:hypothetical protein
MQLIALGDLDRSAENHVRFIGKRFAGITAVDQDTSHLRQTILMMHECRQCTSSIRHICCRHGNGMRQPLCVDCDMTLNSRHLFAGVIAFALGRVSILYALRINDAKRRLFFAAKADAGRANRIFLRPAPADSIHPPLAWRSSGKNTNTLCSNSGIHLVTCATGNRFSIHTARRKTLRRDRFALASSFSSHFPGWCAPFQTARGSRRLGILFSSTQFTHLSCIWQKDRKQALRQRMLQGTIVRSS